MLAPVVQRWRARRDSYRPPDEPIRTSEYDVVPIEGDGSDTIAKSFVLAHHYSASYVSALLRFGLYRRGELVGVAVFSTPQHQAVLAPFPGAKDEKCELGRFVLLDEVPGNGETWMLGRCFELLRREGILSVVSFSDPVARADVAGRIVFPGHIGTIYQAFNAHYLGRTKAETKFLLPDGTALCRRTLSKLLKGDRGRRYVTERLVSFGAPAPRGDLRAWAKRWHRRLTRPFWHEGNHRYAWILNRRVAQLVPSLPYPKLDARRAA